MARRWSWQCRRKECQAELGIVEDGELWPRPGLPIRVDKLGSVHVTCAAMLDSGRLCGRERTWTVRGRKPTAA
jgi:hypothetical protein